MRLLCMLLFAFFMAEQALALPNPAAVYCAKLGYEYKMVQTPEGKKGVVVIEPGVEFDAWDFFRGKVGNEYSFGALYGYDTECVRTNIGTYVVEYAVCVSKGKDGLKSGMRIPLQELMEQKGVPLFDETIDGKKKTSSGAGVPGDINEDMLGIYEIMGQGKMLPAAFDWRTNNTHTYIGPIRDQGDCGSCYAFAAAASAEGTYNWATGKYDAQCVDFSESYIIWCLGRLAQYNDHFYGCDGADWDYEELTALTVEGICNETNFPYTISDPGSCSHWSDPVTVFSSWHRAPCSDIDAIKTAIMTYGVVDASVYVSGSFQPYSGGIYTDANTNCDETPCYYKYTNHAIALVGWNDSDGGYWILRNSWGSDWGESGYMRITYNAARVACEVCYLTYLVTNMNVLGTNGAVIASDESASAAKGTDFGIWTAGASFTNTFSITNSGIYALEITAVTTSGTGAAYFRVNMMTGIVSVGSASNFTMAFDATLAGVHTAVIAIANNMPTTPYRVNLRGASGGEIGLSTTALAFAGTYGGANPSASTFTITNLNQTGFNFTNAISYGSGVSGWLNVLPAIGSVAGDGAQVVTGSVDIGSLNAGVYMATNAVTSTNAPNSPQNVVVTLTVSKANQAITNFPNPGTQITTNTVRLWAQASSELPVTNFTVNLGPGVISGLTNLTFTNSGTVSVTANQAGNTNWNAAPNVTNSVTVHDVSTLAAPQNLAASDGTYKDKVAVTWSAVSGAGGYQVWRHTANDSASASNINHVSQTSCDDATAIPGVRYYYWLQATNDAGASGFSANDMGWRRSAAATDYAHCDIDGDGLADPLVYNKATRTWKVLLSGSGYAPLAQEFGNLDCWPVPGDYDGDGLTDLALYQEATGTWNILFSGMGYTLVQVILGGTGQRPAQGDYDADGLTDLVVYQVATAGWRLCLSAAGYEVIPLTFGESGCRPVQGDYDGDGCTDPALYQTTMGTWRILLSASGYGEVSASLGGSGAVPVQGDYDGDGLTDPAVYREATGEWLIILSAAGYYPVSITCGGPGYWPLVDDFDGDGQVDPAAYQEATGTWRAIFSSGGYAPLSWVFGGPGYLPAGIVRP